MVGRDPVKLLAYEAKRRPLVKEMWERRATLTDEEIDTAALPLAWYRAAFKKARAEALQDQAMSEILDVALANPLGEADLEAGANSTMGTTVQYMGQPGWFKTGGRVSFEVEVKQSTWLHFPETGGCWDNQTFFHNIPDEFLENRVIAKQTRKEYVEAWAAELCRRF